MADSSQEENSGLSSDGLPNSTDGPSTGLPNSSSDGSPTGCLHDVIENGMCLSCGLMIEETMFDDIDFSKQHQRPKQEQSLSFERDLEKLNLNDGIKIWVIQHINGPRKFVYRMGTRSKILFAYIYLAHLHLRQPFYPDKISAMLNLDRSGIDSALKIASGISSSCLIPQNPAEEMVIAPVVVLSPVSAVLMMARQLEFSPEEIDEITHLTEQIVKLSPLILEDTPQRVAVGIVRYFYERHKRSFINVGKRLGFASSITKKYRDIVIEILKKFNTNPPN